MVQKIYFKKVSKKTISKKKKKKKIMLQNAGLENLRNINNK